MPANFQYITNCHLCNSKQLRHTLALGNSPLANNFTPQPIQQEQYPLNLLECQNCGSNQLNIAVNPDLLFKNYLYVSGTSPVFVKHFADYADQVINFCQLKPKDLCVDLGSNDATLCHQLQRRGMTVVGVEPAINLAIQSNQEGIKTFNEFFTMQTANNLLKEYGLAKCITANNCFAHFVDLKPFVLSVKKLLDPQEGVFIFEVSYAVDMIEQINFDLIYHEHIYQHHLSPLLEMFDSLGMEVFFAERIKTHGGSLRVYVCNEQSKKYPRNIQVLQDLLGKENDLGLKCGDFILNRFDLDKNYASCWNGFQNKIENIKNKLTNILDSYWRDKKSVAIFGCAAKTTTLLSYLNYNNKKLYLAIDDSPLKINTYTPFGPWGLNVCSSDILYSKRRPDVCLIGAWNFADSIIKTHQKYLENGGEFLVPLPEIRKINNSYEGLYEPI